MSDLVAFTSLCLHWQPVGTTSSRVLKNAFVLIDLPDDPSPGTQSIVRSVHDSVVSHTTVNNQARIRIQARTDARGVLRAFPVTAPRVQDPEALSNLTPMLFALGAELGLWWTDSEVIFEDLHRLQREDEIALEPRQFSRVQLWFADQTPFPAALENGLRMVKAGPEARSALRRAAEQAYPAKLVTRGANDETLTVVLEDQALAEAHELALMLQEAAHQPVEHHIAAHQLLLSGVVDILAKRGKQGDPMRSVIPMHERIGGPEYRSLLGDLETVPTDCARAVAEAGAPLLRVYEQAFYELSFHPYPEGNTGSQAPGPISRRFTAKRLLDAVALHLRHELIDRVYKADDEGLNDRLLAIAEGKADPDGSEAEKLIAQTSAVLAWLNKASSFVRKGVGLAEKLTDPDLPFDLTSWLESTLVLGASSAEINLMGSRAIQAGMTRAVRLARVWEGGREKLEVVVDRSAPVRVATPQPVGLRIERVRDVESWSAKFKRAGNLLKLFNVLSLAEKLLNGKAGGLLQTAVDEHGVIDGLEAAYRVFTRTAETELGVTLARMAPLMGAASIYLSLEKTWGHLQAGNALAALIESAGVGIAILALYLSVGARTPLHLAALLALLGLALAIAAELAYDEDEKLLERYRPRCGDGGAYANARSAVKAIARGIADLAVAPHTRHVETLGW